MRRASVVLRSGIGFLPDDRPPAGVHDGGMETRQGTDLDVAEVMHRGLVSCAAWTPLRTVAKLMALNRIHCVVVFDYGNEADEDRALYGIVSDRDIADAFAAGAIDDRDAGGVAAAPLLTAYPDDDIIRAAQLLAEHGASHLVVLDRRSQRPVGVLSTLDLAGTLSA
jgi:CBS domain-containing protein